ncbi:proteoglycan 4 [Anastrepha obliqua]|uniref:proteoglycan 4 n=1 Tax=Anastrepha obliqua TaxID=95512 RepID=UPI0024098C28|nr:proteoglycan 4 [Anastrepha obliqua]
MTGTQLHSEYRSTYRWHEFTGNSRPEVVRRAPAPNPSQFIGPTNEPPLPRRKKCPELAYKSHEFIIGSEYTDARGGHAGANRLARSEERGTPSRRSKSEGPPVVPNGRAYAIPEEVDGTAKKQAGESNGLFKKTMSKLSTEYRLQFVWPNVRRIKGIEAGDAADHPRKSISMGALKASKQQQQQQLHLRQQPQPAMPTVHKKRTTNQKEATLHELEPLVSDAEESKPHEKQVAIVEKTERKITIRPLSQAFDQERANHFITKKENFGFEKVKDKAGDGVDNKQQEQEVLLNGTAPPRSQPNLDLWFKEVVELRKKAGEYKCRGWGIEIDPELYKKQRDLWDQVSKRSSLSALSLASSVHRPITKEEKEQENNKKSIPLSKATQKSRVPGHAHMLDNKDEISALPARFSNIRHHLERTTGPDVEEGALLPSPTREKLMPAITKRESESQRGSPKKTAASRHGSPQKGSPQKGSPKKVIKSRSQSVGPAENVSPKRQLRSASTAPSARLTAGKKTPTVPHHATTAATTGSGAVERKPRPYDGEDGRETAISVSSCSPQAAPEIPDEPIVKSPPEPTRVKSPEQILMRSPDPVNWTVPLDTGKTFTVTQNVKEGENYSRPQSEIKASTPVEKPPPPPQSAPPQLTEQAKMDAWKHAEPKMGTTSPTGAVGAGRSIVATQPTAGAGGLPSPPPPPQLAGKPVPGSTLRCLDDPIFDVDIGHLGGGGGGIGVSAGGGGNTSSSSTSTTTAVTARTTAHDVLEKARDRFDRFWGGSKEEEV